MPRTMLGNRPIYTHYTSNYAKKKTQEGFAYDSAFLKRYYSMLDAEIYFGNRYVEDAQEVNWSVTQGQLALFGYNSYVYDEIAIGSRLIQGQFAIHFTSPNYLFDLLKEAENGSIFSLGDYSVTKAKEELTLEEKRTSGIVEKNFSDAAPLWPQAFDIDVIFGQKTGRGNPVHVVLEGAVIKDCRMGVGVSGESVVEIYSFIARDVKTVV